MISCNVHSYGSPRPFSMMVHYRALDNSFNVGWLYGLNYWDLVVDYLNQDFSRMIPTDLFTRIPTIILNTQIAKEEFLKLHYEAVRGLIDRIFVDDSYPQLTTAQKFYAYVQSVSHAESHFGATMETLSMFISYQYNVNVRPDYVVTENIITGINIDDTDDVGSYAEAMYNALCEDLKASKDGIIVRNSYCFSSLCDAFIYFLFEMIDKNCNLKKCPNCGKYFVPENRSDTIYCDSGSPQMPTKTCQEYRKYINFLKKTQEDEAVKLYRQIYNRNMNRIRRIRSCGGQAGKLTNRLDMFMSEAAQWKADIKAGAKTEDEYIAWLKDVKEKKVL